MPKPSGAQHAARIFDHFTDIQRHHSTRDDEHVQSFQPQLTSLQQQLLRLLDIPPGAYHAPTARP